MSITCSYSCLFFSTTFIVENSFTECVLINFFDKKHGHLKPRLKPFLITLKKQFSIAILITYFTESNDNRTDSDFFSMYSYKKKKKKPNNGLNPSGKRKCFVFWVFSR